MMEFGLALILIGGAVFAVICLYELIRGIVILFADGEWKISMLVICIILVVAGTILYAIGGRAG